LKKQKARQLPGFLLDSNLKQYLKFLVEIAYRARDVDSARDTPLAVFYTLDDARGLAALGTVSRLRRVHFLFAITSFCNLCHGLGVSPSGGCLCTHAQGSDARGFNGAVVCCLHRKVIAWKERDSL